MLFLASHSKSHSRVASTTPKSERCSGEPLSVMIGSFQDHKADGFSMELSEELGQGLLPSGDFLKIFFSVSFFFLF